MVVIFLKLVSIVSNSFKYPFKDLKHLAFVFLLFVLLAILPIGIMVGNDITVMIGLVAIFVFILIAPGYMILVINAGSDESPGIPRIKVLRSIVNTFKLVILHICYISIPTIIAFLILSFATGFWDISMLFEHPENILGAISITLVGTLIVLWIFSILSLIAKARLAKYNSLIQALKINKVVGDIKKIGFGKFIGWYVVMAILIGIVRIVAFFLVFVPYAGLILYLCIVIPIILLIYNYSIGLLYSDLSEGRKGEFDFEKFEKEIEYIKYGRIH